MTAQQSPVEELTYEQAHDELESIILTLETDKHPLEEAMAFFERGMMLTQRCTYLLEKAELKVQLISGEEILANNS